ncbi:MAG: YncE family protein, partial [Candidatus Caldatribacteriaceae bacterium]
MQRSFVLWIVVAFLTLGLAPVFALNFPSGGQGPWGIAITQNQQNLIVANVSSNEVAFIDMTSGAVLAEVASGQGPKNLTLSGDGATCYVVNSQSNDVSILDVTNKQVTGHIAIEGSPQNLQITP